MGTKYKCIKKILTITVSLVLVLVPVIGSLINGPMYCDSGYYISMVERITEGYIPYKTLCLGYTPLWFYLTAGYKLLFNIPNGIYEPYLFLNYIYQFSTAYILYRILIKFEIHKVLSFWGSIIFLLTSHWLQGNVVMLETPSVFWGMLSCLLIIIFKNKHSYNYLWIGFLCCFSFLTKQFGLGFFPLGIYLICIYSNDNKIQKLLSFIIGFFIPLIFCFTYWEKDFLNIIFSGYGTISAKEAGWDVSLIGKLEQIYENSLYNFKRINPIVPISLIFTPYIIEQNKWKEFLFAWLGFGFLLQYYFIGGGLHYQLYVIPFYIIIMCILLSLKVNKVMKYSIIAFTLLSISLSLYSTYYNRVYKIYIKSDTKNEQINRANFVKENTEDNKSLFIVNTGLQEIYFLSQMLPPNIDKIGYSFGALGVNKEEGKKQVEDADYILRFTADYAYDAFFTPELKEYCEQKPSIYYNEDIVLHINKE